MIRLNSSTAVTNDNGYYHFDGASVDSTTFVLSNGTYTLTGVPSSHPLAIISDLSQNITYSGTSTGTGMSQPIPGYTYYHTEDIIIQVTDYFGVASIHCGNHGYMGGLNLFRHDWLADPSANRFKNTYLSDVNNSGFALDMSGDLVVRGNLGIANGYFQMNNASNSTKVFLTTNGDSYLNGGNVGIGTTTPSTTLEVIGDATATSFNATSDLRLKENIKPLENSLNKICSLEGVEFNLKNNKDNKMVGFIAQEVEKIVPEVVNTANDEDKYKSIAYGNVTALLVEAIKELRSEIDTLKNK